ncbi:MAG TPA: hypothetical protein VG900_04130 [Hyphomicrobiaceae bacterium]|jgi:hypothetical protein|nr:hypothetical protein [Hyphomicrobiaceae bacterium]
MAEKPEDKGAMMPLAGQPGGAPNYGRPPKRGGSQRQGIGETAVKALIRSIAGRLGTIIVRMITGRLR